MDISQELTKRIAALPHDQQQLVLRFVASLSANAAAGEKGSALREFAHSIDSISAHEMTQAIEEGCERVDPSEW